MVVKSATMKRLMDLDFPEHIAYVLALDRNMKDLRELDPADFTHIIQEQDAEVELSTIQEWHTTIQNTKTRRVDPLPPMVFRCLNRTVIIETAGETRLRGMIDREIESALAYGDMLKDLTDAIFKRDD